MDWSKIVLSIAALAALSTMIAIIYLSNTERYVSSHKAEKDVLAFYASCDGDVVQDFKFEPGHQYVLVLSCVAK